MKIVCSIYVGNRVLPSNLNSKGRKHVKSTLALCKHPKSGEFCIILFTNQNKNGTKYTIRNNIKQVLTKFAHEGKCTIQFLSPEHDIFINADPIQLKAFLHLFKRILENKVSEKELTTSSLAVTGVKAKDMPPLKLTISKRSDYPSKGFPKTLEELHINSINRCGVDKGILTLMRLKILDLSDNLIEYVPTELSLLPNLRDLNLSQNLLGKSKNWNWIGGNLSNTLQSLDLSHNELKLVPQQISYLSQLTNLNLSYNLLQNLTPGIGKLKKLKVFCASNNNINTLPGNMRSLTLQTIDLSLNNFMQDVPTKPLHRIDPLPVCTLKEYAARKVLRARLPYPPGSLPLTVISYLDNANFCVCGRACLEIYVRTSQNLLLTSIAESVNRSVGEGICVPIDSYFCSSRCYASVCRTRNPIVR
ncbi:leucine-rich repeat protein 1 [Diorhabda carinulata]|uniref:leucine-rich repeat protein 1 n=1 Tax=Diorhabda carinulata TaxID=1163345 RepID=UPI0025A20594|nr:leucine-rich repeat protein 1 [Diorhabda carinulata]